MRRIAVFCLLPVLAGSVGAEMTAEQRVDLLWERAVRQSDFAKFDGALESGRRALEIAPENADAWALMAYVNWLHPDGLEHLAKGQVQRALGLNPDSARARMVHGLVLQATTDPPDFERAVGELERAVALDPELPRAWSMLALGYLDAGQPEKALPPAQNAVELDREYYEWAMNLAECLSAVGEQARAVGAARRAVELSFSDFSEQLARNNLAWHLCLLLPEDVEQRVEAVHNARRAVEIAPDDATNLDTLGTAEVLFGDAERAAAAFEAAIERGTDSYAGLGCALAFAGKEAEAREALKRYSSLHLDGRTAAHDAGLAGLAWEALGQPEVTARIYEAALDRWAEHPWAECMRTWMAGKSEK